MSTCGQVSGLERARGATNRDVRLLSTCFDFCCLLRLLSTAFDFRLLSTVVDFRLRSTSFDLVFDFRLLSVFSTYFDLCRLLSTFDFFRLF